MQPLTPKRPPQLALIGPSIDHATFMPPARRESTLAEHRELPRNAEAQPIFKIVHDPQPGPMEVPEAPKLTKKGHRFLFRRRARS